MDKRGVGNLRLTTEIIIRQFIQVSHKPLYCTGNIKLSFGTGRQVVALA